MTTYTIRTGASKLGISEQYLRKCIREGKISTKLVKIGSNPNSPQRHEISESELMKFKKRTSVRTSRDDGRNKFVVYLTKSEERVLRQLMSNNKLTNVEKLLKRANPSK